MATKSTRTEIHSTFKRYIYVNSERKRRPRPKRRSYVTTTSPERKVEKEVIITELPGELSRVLKAQKEKTTFDESRSHSDTLVRRPADPVREHVQPEVNKEITKAHNSHQLTPIKVTEATGKIQRSQKKDQPTSYQQQFDQHLLQKKQDLHQKATKKEEQPRPYTSQYVPAGQSLSKYHKQGEEKSSTEPSSSLFLAGTGFLP